MIICFSFLCSVCVFPSFLKYLLCVGVCFPTSSLLPFHTFPGSSQPPSQFEHLSIYMEMTTSEHGTAPGRHYQWILALFSKQSSPSVHCAPRRLCPLIGVSAPDESYFSDLYANDFLDLYLQHWSFQTPFSNCLLDTSIGSSLSSSTVPGGVANVQ